MKTSTEWTGGHSFDSVQNQTSIHIDSNGGFSPKALLLTGLAGCTGIDVVDLLEKMRVPFSRLRIEAEAEQTAEHPKVFTDIHVNYILRTAEENRDKVRKAIDLSLEKYCGVAAMLRKNSKILYTITLQPDLE
jgi:putative redox protein